MKNQTTLRIISILTLLFFIQACTLHTVRERPVEKADEFNDLKILIVNSPDQTFELKDFKIADGKIKGKVDLNSPEIKKSYKRKQLQIFVEKGNFVQDDLIDISFNIVDKIEFYKQNTLLSVTAVLAIGVFLFYTIEFYELSQNGMNL